MSLATNLTDLATRISTEVKALRTLINGNQVDLSALTTTAKNNLVAAINEVDAAVGAGSPTTLDDLTDVVVSSTATGHVLRHNGTNFVNVLGTDHFQPLDSDLTAIAALSTTSYGRGLLELANQAALLTAIGDASATAKGVVELATDAEGITGTDTVRATTPANIAAILTDRIDTNTALGSSNIKVPSQAAVKAYADALIGAANGLTFQGVIDASANPNYPAASAGDLYRISVAGKIGGASGPNVEVGDLILALADGLSAGNHATVGSSWNITQVNIDGAVTGPTSATDNNFAQFNGTSGKIIEDSGVALSTSTSLGTSDALIPSQNAVKTYADTKQTADATLTALAGVSTAADKLIYATGSDTFTTTDLSSYARTLLDDADAATARGTLSVYSQAQIGDPETDLVAVFEAGLV